MTEKQSYWNRYSPRLLGALDQVSSDAIVRFFEWTWWRRSQKIFFRVICELNCLDNPINSIYRTRGKSRSSVDYCINIAARPYHGIIEKFFCRNICLL